MKILLISFLWMISYFTTDAQNFEGVISFTFKNATSEENKATFTLNGKSSLFELESNMDRFKTLTNSETGMFYLLVGKDKMAIKINMNHPLMQQKKRPNSTATKEDLKLEWTKEKRMIRGHSCEKINGSNEEIEGYAWVTKELNISLTDLVPMMKMGNNLTPNNIMKDVYSDLGFVMEIYAKEKKTGKISIMETEVEEKSVDLTEEKILKGYQVFDIANMFEMLVATEKDPEKFEALMKKFEKIKWN